MNCDIIKNKTKEDELINLSNLVGSVFLTDQGKNIEDNLERIKRFSDQIEKLDPEEFELFFAWAKNILMRGKPETEVSEAIEIFKTKIPEAKVLRNYTE